MDYIIRQNRETVFQGETPILEINVKYPEFDFGGNPVEKSINTFYETVAQNFCANARKRTARKAMAAVIKEGRRPFGEVIIPKVAGKDKYVSVILDVFHYDGIFGRERRFTQVWDTESGLTLPYRFFLPMSRRAVVKRISEILAEQLNGSPIHDFYSGCVETAKRRFDGDCFFLSEKGVVFCYQSGVLSPQNEGSVCFTVPYPE